MVLVRSSGSTACLMEIEGFAARLFGVIETFRPIAFDRCEMRMEGSCAFLQEVPNRAKALTMF